MTHFKAAGIIVFLDVDLATLESRINNFDTRGLAKRPDQSFAELFDERFILYTKYADVTVKCADLTQEEVCGRIINELRTRKLIPKLSG
jgi:shikimate kinase